MLLSSQRCVIQHNLHDVRPVPGMMGHPVPTTGDVQLYPDPATCGSKVPILYADCEGLTGGDTLPRALESDYRPDVGAQHRPIAWANAVNGGTERSYLVANVFPKLLYTFSDVVVFVTREARLVTRSSPKLTFGRLLVTSAYTRRQEGRVDCHQPTRPMGREGYG